MVLVEPGAPASSAPGEDREHVIWHDLECGGYRADLALWRELAQQARAAREPAPILDIGAGTGRVALALARAGHCVTALDLDPLLLRALVERAGRLQIDTVCADARTFALERDDFALCLVPMQTIQLLGGAAARNELLVRARAHLRPGGLLACAIVTAVEPFDCAAGDVGPGAETSHVEGRVYISRAVGVHSGAERIRIERERHVNADGHAAATAPRERDVIELDRVSAAQLQGEGLAAGFMSARVLEIAPTAEHVGSTVVTFGV